MGFQDTRAVRRFAPEKLQKVNLFETGDMFCDIYCLEPGQEQTVHAHAGATKFYYVIEGTARITIGDSIRQLSPGEIAWSLPDEPHGAANESEDRVVMLVAMAPNPNSS